PATSDIYTLSLHDALPISLTGDLGYSVISGRPVSGLLLQRLPVTLTLAVGASLISLSIGLVLGVLSAVKRGRGLDMLFTVISLVDRKSTRLNSSHVKISYA